MLVPEVLAVAVVALGAIAVATTLFIVVHTYSPVLFWDHWNLIHTLMESHGHPRVRDFWAQHNEHRMVTGRMFGFADLYWFGGRNVSLYTEIIALQLFHLVLFLLVFRRLGSLPRTTFLTLAGFCTYCLFSPIQMENFIWAFQTVFILTSLAATACCFAVLYHARRVENVDGSKSLGFLLLAVGWAFIAEITEAHGLVTWPVLLFLAFALRLPKRDKAIISVTASFAIAAYGIGYRSPPGSKPMMDALQHPTRLFHFIVTYLGRSWDAQLPNGSAWPSVSESLTGLIIGATLVCALNCIRKPLTFSPLQIALVGNLLFGLGTAGMTALGRLQLGGLQGATAIRYETPALVFWVSLAALIAVSVDWNRPWRLPIAQGTLLILMIAGGGRWFEMGSFAEARQYGQEIAWNAMVEGRFEDPALGHISFEPGALKKYFPYMREHHWGPAGLITYFARLQPISSPLRIEGYQLQPTCVGHWDEGRRSGLVGVLIGGWAMSQVAGEVPRRVAFVSNSGKILPVCGFREGTARRRRPVPQCAERQDGMGSQPECTGRGSLSRIFALRRKPHRVLCAR